MSSLHSQAGKDKEAMEEDYQKALELILLMATDAVHINTSSAVTY